MKVDVRAVSAVWAVLVCLHWSTAAAPSSSCTSEVAGCGSGGGGGSSLVDLFDRVIQHSSRMHSITSDLHALFEQYFLPSRNPIGRLGRSCHTSAIFTPNGKENAQRMAREELTAVILQLLVAWRKPMGLFHQNMAQYQDFNRLSANRALEMSHMVQELHKGVEKVAQKMEKLGILTNSVSGQSVPEVLFPWNVAEGHRVKNSDLLYCFRRDSNKVQNYLKILKCRILPEHGC